MPLVKVKEKFQITIPASIRKKLGLKVGDYLKLEESGDSIVLRPVAVIDKRKREALERLERVLEQVQQKLEDIPEEEVEKDVLEALRAVRSGFGD
ncbi:AbrB/MazE/SpoVT family DNA-binding domain-containing protein [Candidatus Bipolaricaulota bacterium]|nr:AbrB/MazE/SpoVT family DNA-binding domain-containing protein [Candidatus Bipolaricaulota bacterium]